VKKPHVLRHSSPYVWLCCHSRTEPLALRTTLSHPWPDCQWTYMLSTMWTGQLLTRRGLQLLKECAMIGWTAHVSSYCRNELSSYVLRRPWDTSPSPFIRHKYPAECLVMCRYVHNLKCLNESFMRWIDQHVQFNPYCILSDVVRDYDRHLDVLNKRFDITPDILSRNAVARCSAPAIAGSSGMYIFVFVLFETGTVLLDWSCHSNVKWLHPEAGFVWAGGKRLPGGPVKRHKGSLKQNLK